MLIKKIWSIYKCKKKNYKQINLINKNYKNVLKIFRDILQKIFKIQKIFNKVLNKIKNQKY